MAHPSSFSSLRDRKLVVLGIPYDVETDELRYYMSKFGELEDVIVMKDRATGQPRGFGYVTFMSVEDARKATAAQHVLNGRTLDVKVATPREEMWPSGSRKINRIFVARIPPSVTEDVFRSYFQKYGAIVDAYMPKEMGSRSHRGIGFVTFENPDSVDTLMNETHELGGSTIAVDRATPKEETLKFWGKSFPDQYSFYNAYMAAAAAAAAQYGAFGVGPMAGAMGGYDFTGYGFAGDAGFGGQENSGGAENNWESYEGGVVKSPSLASAQAATPATGYGSAASPSGAQVAMPAAGYGASAPHNDATNSTVFGSDPSHRVATNATAPLGYGPGVPYNNIHGMATFVPGYGFSAQPAATCATGYAASASDGSALNSAIPADGYGFGPSYGGASMVPAASAYGASGAYSGAPPAPTPGPGIVSNASESGASGLQSYAAEYGSVGVYNGPSDTPASGAGAPYSSAPAAPNSGSDYAPNGPNVTYSAAPTGPASATVYGSTASYGGAQAAPTSASEYGSSGPTPMGNKVFIGRLPMEATAEHLRTYFSSFGRILDVYVPKDAKKRGHRGFGFVTFFEDGVAEQVSLQSHEILGQPIAVDRPTPQDGGANMPYPSNLSANPSMGGAAGWGNTPAYQRMGYSSLPASFDYFSGGWAPYAGNNAGPPASSDGSSGNRSSRTDSRYKPY